MVKKKLLLVIILFLAVILRFTNLARIPNGFIPEEVSTGWNAYSLLKTGRDEWGTLLPIIFKETGGFKLALNSYLIVPAMAIFGVNEFAVRFPTALAGVLSVLFTYVLVKKLWNNEAYALGAALLLAINPWAISMGRYAVDVNLGIPLFLLGLIFFLKARENQKFFWFSSIAFALTYYTYFNFVVFTVLFLAGLFISDWRNWWSKKGQVIVFFFVQFLFLLPYIIAPNLTTRFSQATSVGTIGFLNQIHEHREACQKTYPTVICRVVYNKPVGKMWELTRNYINHYSTTTFFLHGSKLGLSGMPDGWGFLYPFEFLFIVGGLVVIIRKKLASAPLLLWFFLYGVPSSLAGEQHIWRMMTFLPLPQIIGGVGMVKFMKTLKLPGIKLGVALFSGFLVLRFLTDYFAAFPYAQATNAYFGFRDVYQYVSSIEKNYPAIVVAPTGLGFDQLYIYYLFYTQYDPARYQQAQEVQREVGVEGWVKVNAIGKWQFASDVRNLIFSLPDHTLLVAEGGFNENAPLPKRVMTPKLIHTIFYPNGDPAFKILELEKNATVAAELTK